MGKRESGPRFISGGLDVIKDGEGEVGEDSRETVLDLFLQLERQIEKGQMERATDTARAIAKKDSSLVSTANQKVEDGWRTGRGSKVSKPGIRGKKR
ncbi:hypothetical protein A2316_03435 [Candidatus Falkowbacteria bacterium RIFOXYB2_FULL_38_15]|uniref:Uncharacterized protein n=1 Tax=Candidatus Falkowbacteria bacterium RIFOXYA2_FULL_38_12 TaxID=1797993 RepID=A0A1F5S3B6_9BACT|nr:MAG: hypothetical protein A2257_01790 [Candidatus Falkowbacteria bacterium RIFOXYA2_FULL_38_12]OGF32972.1 MAG: hypothetical protein A2316_03435 [Candidatus Falkowbacteria bacterium RIFOXYB2_FULL_38_15]OGF42630.1 MAG: hypothetical protein A2555_02505 [Candidatus Falkowbacteria bacterium RIFOXYD2_FULL_39_16]